MRSANKGFTLVELIVVIAIIAILASVSIVGYNQFIQNARDSRAETELDVIVRQLEAEYYIDAFEDSEDTVADPVDGNSGSYDISEKSFGLVSGTFTVTVTGVTSESGVERIEANENAFVVALVVAAINAAIEGTLAEAGADVEDAPTEEAARALDDGLYVYYDGEDLVLRYVADGGVASIEDWADTVDFTVAD